MEKSQVDDDAFYCSVKEKDHEEQEEDKFALDTDSLALKQLGDECKIFHTS